VDKTSVERPGTGFSVTGGFKVERGAYTIPQSTASAVVT